MSTAIARDAAVQVVGTDAVTTLTTANMGGEDFSCYLNHVPGCYIRYGGRIPGRPSFPAHSSRFDFAESAMPVASAWMDRVARLAGTAMAIRRLRP
jgi:hippurate hydrolase